VSIKDVPVLIDSIRLAMVISHASKHVAALFVHERSRQNVF
jgi:hypothetical protein